LVLQPEGFSEVLSHHVIVSRSCLNIRTWLLQISWTAKDQFSKHMCLRESALAGIFLVPINCSLCGEQGQGKNQPTAGAFLPAEEITRVSSDGTRLHSRVPSLKTSLENFL
jgi:hypothetical protein